MGETLIEQDSRIEIERRKMCKRERGARFGYLFFERKKSGWHRYLDRVSKQGGRAHGRWSPIQERGGVVVWLPAGINECTYKRPYLHTAEWRMATDASYAAPFGPHSRRCGAHWCSPAPVLPIRANPHRQHCPCTFEHGWGQGSTCRGDLWSLTSALLA
jgi:hypothetical protein